MTIDSDQDEPFMVIAIDGGAASGKSSTSRELAHRLNLLHVDTGSHYRAVALACLEAGIDPVEGSRLEAFLRELKLDSVVRGHESLIAFSGKAPPGTAALRSDPVNATVSPVAAIPLVRETVKAYQRDQVQLARQAGFRGIIMDGRDIGTVILPDADLKVFLTADEATRQLRRQREGGSDAISDRDRRDSSRPNAPLKAAGDAVIIDNSHLSLEEVVAQILDLLRAKGLLHG